MKVSPPPPAILALSGKIGSGKDTAVECLTEHFLGLDKTVIHLKFANALKRASAIITGMPENDQYTKEGKGKTIPGLNMTVGEFQQQCGTVLREHINQNIWVNAVLNQIKNDPTARHVYLISDCRFKNEARKIQEMGGMVIRLNRTKVDAELIGGRDTSHVSETDLDDYADFDFVYQNDGTIEELNQAIIGFLR
jgi:uncharacterized short protein YbdD (DUF466 family)